VNPFLYSGGKFLLFYVLLSGLVIVAVAWMGRGRSGPTPRISELTADPYGIAVLREGPLEAIRIAVFNLLDRGLVERRDDGCLVTARPDAADLVRRPLDKAVLQRCRQPSTPGEVLDHPAAQREARIYEMSLVGRGLLPDTADVARRWTLRLAACTFLALVALAKFALAVSQGRTNTTFLLIVTAFACLGVFLVSRSRRTPSGERALADLKAIASRLWQRAETLKPGGATNEALLLASVFGLWALPSQAFPFIEDVFPRPKPDGGSGDSGGGSDSSDGGSGCGGGCGGCGSD
jgi:uncharacterized protein (TIGR04222 family)